MKSFNNSAAKKIVDVLRNTFRHLEASEIKQDDPHLLEIKGQLVRSIIALENLSESQRDGHRHKLVA